MPPKKKRFTDDVINIDSKPPTLNEKIAAPKQGVAPSRQGKATLTVYVEKEFKKEIKKVALENDVSLEAFVIEGMRLALAQYKK